LRFKGAKFGKSATISGGEKKMMTLTEKWKMEGWMVGKAEGKMEGKIEGKIEGKKEVLIKLIQLKFGAVPEDLEKVIHECNNLEELDKILTKVALANSIEEINIKLG
jgi:predicted transposase YdaD